MSNLIENIMFNDEQPWGGFGNYIGNEAISSKEAIKAAGLDWTVATKDLFFKAPSHLICNDLDLENLDTIKVPNKKVIYRESDNSPLGVVGDRYSPIQNHEAFSMMDSLVDEGLMKYHTAGSLRGGQRIWMLGKIGDMSIVPNDQVDKYLLLYNTHDGSSTLRCFFTTIRIACINAVNAALRENKGVGITIRHSGNVIYKMDESKEILGIANKTFDQYEEFAKALTRKNMSSAELKKFSEILFPDPPEDAKRKSERHIENREQIEHLFVSGKGQDIKGVNGTAWAAYNAMTEFVNYHSNRRGTNVQEKRFESAVLGVNNKIIERGTQELLKLVA